ncbi:uncharacterized protein KGF55_004227 [Candida pseudojiufengensis]|uniref:uncharacterized protein n=1 Tax=Candida pseudojiufengensis TaxID=497109 RepID=UPI002224DC92|nr:uncharacterized protein KGF55_004227 [Candida pseudojiufengensis]KAI5960960.1 hypothetical protein KGF55_004227 [Candida pseudojiufengensis]
MVTTIKEGVNDPKILSSQQSIQFDQLPVEILNRIVYWLSNATLILESNSTGKFPAFTYIVNSERCGDCYQDLLSLSSTNCYFRQYLGATIFRNVSLVRLNQVDSLLCSPKSRELFSDKKSYQREFLSELIMKNIQNCGNSDLARSGYKLHYFGDRSFRSKYQELLCICNYVTYLECDNSFLSGKEPQLFVNLKELKVLDEAVESPISQELNFPSISYLAVHVQTLQSTKGLLNTLTNLRRLDLFVAYGDIPNGQGLQRILYHLNQTKVRIEEFVLILDNAYTIIYADTIRLLQSIKTSNLNKLAIRVNRRKSLPIHCDKNYEVYSEYVGEDLLSVFQQPQHLIIDVSVLKSIKFHPNSINSGNLQNKNQKSKKLTIVDRTITGPQISLDFKEKLGVVVRSCGVTKFSFQYGESLEESHLHVLKIVTDFVQWMVNPILNKNVGYLGLKKISIEKCWGYTDDSIIREYLMDMIESGKLSHKINSTKIWTKTPFNSPRYKIKDSYNIFYSKSSGFSVMDNNGYFIGTSQQTIDKASFVTSNDSKTDGDAGDCFWSIEASLCDFEQYSTRQRKTLLSS